MYGIWILDIVMLWKTRISILNLFQCTFSTFEVLICFRNFDWQESGRRKWGWNMERFLAENKFLLKGSKASDDLIQLLYRWAVFFFSRFPWAWLQGATSTMVRPPIHHTTMTITNPPFNFQWEVLALLVWSQLIPPLYHLCSTLMCTQVKTLFCTVTSLVHFER